MLSKYGKNSAIDNFHFSIAKRIARVNVKRWMGRLP